MAKHRILLGALAPATLMAMTATAQVELPAIEELLVTGGREGVRTATGSATFIEQEAIAEYEVTDLTDLMAQVPGVYVRTEDGYGLRPNIGIRGATAERSQKVTLMEDGVLIAPAPYAAPAAYYVPNVNRMSAVEVFKGPAAIEYGPHTVGGAVNLATAPLTDERSGELAATAGVDGYHKLRALYSDSAGPLQWQLDGLRYGADGFKALDGGGDTGFDRNDLNVKFGWQSQPGQGLDQRLVVKLGYADETSHETYLGLTDEDFAADPDRRYRASALDEFNSEHTQAHLFHTLEADQWQLTSRAYLNRFERSWNKFDGFMPAELAETGYPYQNALSAGQLMDNAQYFPRRMAILRGELDSRERPSEALDITNNDRDYGSEGVQSQLEYRLDGEVSQTLEVGVRYHRDHVERDHRVAGYWMRGGQLVSDGVSYPDKVDNRAEAEALAVFVRDEIQWRDLTVNLGLRGERIDTELANHQTGEVTTATQDVLAPGVGLYWQLTDNLGLLGGVYQGFSPAGAGASDQVEPEKSTNAEVGLRLNLGGLSLEAITFMSDYSNLLGRCRVSDTGCQVGEEFNGGEVDIRGQEINASYVWAFANGVEVPLALTYTFTDTEFGSDFSSGFSQWGTVESGDELPYVPDHQGRLSLGLDALDWRLDLAAVYTGERRERAGQGSAAEGEYLDDYVTLDISGAYDLTDRWTVRLVVENALDERVIVSRRPYAARPNPPRMVKAGVHYHF